MEFVDDFNNLAPEYFYIALCSLLTITAFSCGPRSFVGPIALSSIYVYGALLLMAGVGESQLIQGSVLAIIFFVFLKLGLVLPTIKLRSNRLKVEFNYHYSRIFFAAVILIYFLFLKILMVGFSESSKIDKINWVTNAGWLPYVWALLNGVLISLSFLLLVLRRYLIFFVAIIGLAIGGHVFGEKIVFINIAVLTVVVIFQEPLKPLRLFLSAIVSSAFLILTFAYSFGAMEAGWSNASIAFFARAVATYDGTMIILKTGMYENYQMSHSYLYYVFDFILSKFYGVSPGIGQTLASANVYKYPENGGPNDSLVNYFLLSDAYDKILVGASFAFFAFLLGALDKVVKNKRVNEYSLGWKFTLIPLYLLLPSFFQATGTAFILLARYYVLLMPLIVLIYLARGMIKNVRT